jgi:predicted metal-binding transcription factor (methanogenesis marker protein 9)
MKKKHIAKPATLDQVLNTYGLSKKEYLETKKAVLKRI